MQNCTADLNGQIFKGYVAFKKTYLIITNTCNPHYKLLACLSEGDK